MRRIPATALFAALAAIFVLSSPAAAQDVTGTWNLTWETPRGAQTVIFVFAQEGMHVTGTAQMRMGEVAIKNGMIHGDQFTFTLELGRGDRTMAQNFSATVGVTSMQGKITTPRGENPFTGARKQG